MYPPIPGVRDPIRSQFLRTVLFKIMNPSGIISSQCVFFIGINIILVLKPSHLHQCAFGRIHPINHSDSGFRQLTVLCNCKSSGKQDYILSIPVCRLWSLMAATQYNPHCSPQAPQKRTCIYKCAKLHWSFFAFCLELLILLRKDSLSSNSSL